MNQIFETLNKLTDNERKQPMHIYLDEKTGQIKEVPLKLDSAGASILVNQVNAAKSIHNFMFGH